MTKFVVWWTLIWWRISQFFTGFRAVPVPPVASYQEIVDAFDAGALYRYDRKWSAFLHPGEFQRRLEAGKKAGDCEDHAAYWVACLKNTLLRGAPGAPVTGRHRIGIVRGTDSKGKAQGHGVIVFWDMRDELLCWADYGLPHKQVEQVEGPTGMRVVRLPNDSWVWAEQVAKGYGWKLKYAFTVEVIRLTPRGALKFGNIRIMP